MSTDLPQRNLRVLARFVDSLDLLKRWLVPILALIALASSIPQFYLWYVGETVRCLAGEACATTIAGFELPLTITGLLLIAVLGVGARITAWLTFELAGMWSTNALHDRMIGALARARTTWFDETPSGHVLNRILSDFGNLRMMGVIRLGDATNAIAEVLAIAILVGFVNIGVAAALIPATAAFLYVQLNIGPMLGHAQEIASNWKGEALHRETDLIEGRRIFALYGKEGELLSRLGAAWSRLADARILAQRLTAWSRLWVRIVSALYGFVVFAAVAASVERGELSMSLAAVIVSALFALTASFGWLSWCLTYLTETLGNARRVFELVDRPREEDEELAMARPAAAAARAPLAGDIEFRGLSMSYRPGLPKVLDGLSLTIPAGKRTGVIGRTGAGKSSLVQTLFRMVHVVGGDVTIGGTSIYSVDLDTLRRRFGVVPQDPYLFAGTVRDNLDRGGAAPDAALTEALARVELALPLDHPVEEGGRNLSVGERQLLCLARILLADKPFVLMDEPTSAVDAGTDAKIQRLLATALGGRTVVTIAHRLDTLRHYDWIVELDAGRLRRAGPAAEFFPDQ